MSYWASRCWWKLLALILVPVLLTGGYPKNVMIMAAMLTVGPSLAAIGAVFFAGDAIAGEFESKTGFLLFTNPIKRVVLWTGKYLAGLIAVASADNLSPISLSLLRCGDLSSGAYRRYFGSFGLCLLYASAVLSLTFFFSAISKGSMGATVMTLALYLGDFRHCGECSRFHRQSLLVYDIGRRRQHYPALRKHGELMSGLGMSGNLGSR